MILLDDVLSDGVVTPRIYRLVISSQRMMSTIVCRVFFSTDELFGMEQVSISSGPDFIENGRFKIDIHGSRNILSVSYSSAIDSLMEGMRPVSEKKVDKLPLSVCSFFKRPSG